MRKSIRMGAIFTACMLIVGVFPSGNCFAASDPMPTYTTESLDGWYKSGSSENLYIFGKDPGTAPIQIDKGSSTAFPVNESLPDGKFNLILNYRVTNASSSGLELEITVDGEKPLYGNLSVLWTDATKDYETDNNGDEILPDQKAVEEYVSDIVINSSNVAGNALIFDLTAGTHFFTVKSVSQSIEIKSAFLQPPETLNSYKDYMQNFESNGNTGHLITTEGEGYALKSESYIRSGSVKNPALHPYQKGKKKVALLNGATWSSVGQKVLWNIEVPEDGLYDIALHYNQSAEAGMQCYRRITIDGKVPYAELEALSVPATESDEYKNYTLADGKGNPYRIYLTAGTHTFSMQTTMGGFYPVYNELLSVMNEINEIGMDLRMLSAGSVDTNRTWEMDTVMPQAVPSLKKIVERIQAAYDSLKKLGNRNPTYADSLIYAADTLQKLIEQPRVLPNKTELLNVGDNSVSKFVGTVLSKLITSNISVDCIYFSSGAKLPGESAPFGSHFTAFLYEFITSFSKDYQSPNADISKKNNAELSVWINRSIQYSDMLQRMLDSDFNKDNGTNIKLSIMPSEQKLILANASGTNPDVAIGIGSTVPFDFAIRGAAKNLLEYDDFLSFYQSQFNLEALTPMCYADGVFGTPETQDFQVLFYRKDIFESLGITVPDTWDDVRYLMPTLLRHRMNFFIPLSGATGYKSFSATSPFLFQNGASILSDDGMSVAFQTENAEKAFREMIDFYTVYGMQQTVPSFYNSFRYGEIPVGIGSISLYLQLQAAAPELTGLWDIAPAPGTKTDDGVVRYQTADVTACMIFKNTRQSDNAWAFLKWWLGDSTQAEYAQQMRSNYGPEYFWCTANMTAFRDLPFSEAHMSIITEQLKWQKEVVRHPANYMLEREISNIWNNVVVNGNEFSDAADSAAMNCNREIKLKLEEFGYFDANGKQIKNFITDPVAQLKKKAGKEAAQ